MEDSDLLARIDERSLNSYKLMEKLERSQEKLEKHQEDQNGNIQETLLRTKTNRILIGIGGVGIMLIITWLANLQGLW